MKVNTMKLNVIGVFAVAVFYFIYGNILSHRLNRSGHDIVAEIHEITANRVRYNFHFADNDYKGSFRYSKNANLEMNIGDKVIVRFYEENPALQRAVIKAPFPKNTFPKNVLLDSMSHYYFSWWDVANNNAASKKM